VQGYTCAEFQSLPAHERNQDDAAMLLLAKKKNWKKCPACCIVVERTEGCNHMGCVCGVSFCYACGQK
jgi:hypothetical protein